MKNLTDLVRFFYLSFFGVFTTFLRNFPFYADMACRVLAVSVEGLGKFFHKDIAVYRFKFIFIGTVSANVLVALFYGVKFTLKRAIYLAYFRRKARVCW